MSPNIDDDTVVEELGLFGASYVPIDSLSDEARGMLPKLWVDAAQASASDVGPLLATAWRQLCPGLPKIADLIERRTGRVVIAEMQRRTHWTKSPGGDDGDVWPELGLAYLLRDRFHADEVEIWFGWRPYTSPAWPAGSELIREVTGRLFSDLQNGFVDFFAAGLLPVEDWHTMADMDPDVWRFAGSGGETLPSDQHPDLNQTVIPAEDPASWSHVVFAPGATTPLWAGFNDKLQPKDDVAEEIQTLVGEAWGGTDWYDKL